MGMTPLVARTDSMIMIGDSISLTVWGYPEFITHSLVKQSGTITVPLIGELMAAGYTRQEFTDLLRRRLGEFIHGEIKPALEVISPVPRITVLGTVSRQTSLATTAELPLLEVLSDAGGWTEQSDLRYVTINHRAPSGEGKTIEINLQSHLDLGDVRSLPHVQPGDVVYVPKKENTVREMSEYLRDALLLFGFFRLFN